MKSHLNSSTPLLKFIPALLLLLVKYSQSFTLNHRSFKVSSSTCTFILTSPSSQVASPYQQSSSSTTTTTTTTATTTQLQAGLFGNLFSGKKDKQNDDPSIPTRIMDIPTDSIKPGGLRFALGLFFIGQQGTPVKGSWKANQADDGVLDMYYVDNTAMFSVHLTDKLIYVDRYGRASLQYQLQESLVLHRFLDEIHTLAFEGDEIEDENRLLVLSDPENGIDNARTKLPARAED